MATGEQHSAESERFRAPPPQGVRSFAMYGEAWTVYEATDPTSLARVLIFEGVKTARRVRESRDGGGEAAGEEDGHQHRDDKRRGRHDEQQAVDRDERRRAAGVRVRQPDLDAPVLLAVRATGERDRRPDRRVGCLARLGARP